MLSQQLQISTDALVTMCDEVGCSMPASRSIVTIANNFLNAMSLTIALTSVTCDDLRNAVCACQRQNHLELLRNKPLHGKYIHSATLMVWILYGVSSGLTSIYIVNL